MIRLLLLVGAWAGSPGNGGAAPGFGGRQALELALTLLFMAALWVVATARQRELEAQRDARVVPFPEPSRRAGRGLVSVASNQGRYRT